jgi:hypothetical protein
MPSLNHHIPFNFKTPNLLPVAELDGKKTKAEADAIRVAQALLLAHQSVFPRTVK